MDNSNTIGILKQLERGEISAAQANERLEEPPVERDYIPPIEHKGAPEWARRYWVYPLMAGLVIVGFGAWIIAATVHANILWFVLGLPILLLGTLIVAVAASAQSAHWIYVDVRESKGKSHNVHVAVPFSMALLRAGLWLARLFGAQPKANVSVKGSKVRFDALWTDVDGILTELEKELREGRGLTVNVDDKDERVQVYIV